MKRVVVGVLFLYPFLFLSGAEARLLWKQNLMVEIAGGPAIFDDRAAAVTRNGALFVFDPEGKLLWQKDLKVPLAAAPSYDEGGSLWLADLFGGVHRVTPMGESRQLFKGGSPFRATPLQGEDAVIVCDEEGVLTWINRENGKVLRSVRLESPVFSSGLILADGDVLQPSKDYKVFRIHPAGEKRVWFSGSGVLFSSPAPFGDGRIALTSMDHHLYLLKEDGRALFRFKAGRWIIASPVIDESGRVYFGSYDQCFYAVEPGGKLAWRVKGQGGFNAVPVIDDRGNVYSGDGSGRVYAFSRGGNTLWSHRTGDYVRSSLVLFPDESVLLAASLDGFLYAFRSEAPLSKRAAWPCYLGDERNSGRERRKGDIEMASPLPLP